MFQSSDVFKFHLFADDTNILYANKNMNTLETVVNKEIKKIQEWLIVNKLTINLKKSSYVIFGHYTGLTAPLLLNIGFFKGFNTENIGF